MANDTFMKILADFWIKLKKELTAEIISVQKKPHGVSPTGTGTVLEQQKPPEPARRASGTVLEKEEDNG